VYLLAQQPNIAKTPPNTYHDVPGTSRTLTICKLCQTDDCNRALSPPLTLLIEAPQPTPRAKSPAPARVSIERFGQESFRSQIIAFPIFQLKAPPRTPLSTPAARISSRSGSPRASGPVRCSPTIADHSGSRLHRRRFRSLISVPSCQAPRLGFGSRAHRIHSLGSHSLDQRKFPTTISATKTFRAGKLNDNKIDVPSMGTSLSNSPKQIRGSEVAGVRVAFKTRQTPKFGMPAASET